MGFFVNDLSLHGQYADHLGFRQSLEEVMRCRECATSYGRTLRVSRTILESQVYTNQSFRQAVHATGDKNFITLVMVWIDKNGPFVEDQLMGSPNEYLSLEDDIVVTETAIGEAAARHFQGLPAGLVSFVPSDYQRTPIEVSWHRDSGDVETCELPNFWGLLEFEHYLKDQQSLPRTWEELIAQLPARFSNLTFLPNLEGYLAGEPFSPYVVERTFVLLDVLNQLKTCFDAKGRRTARGDELIDNYFRRRNARFSDASEQEKNDPRFRSAMTFRDPEGRQLECFWHGKIKSPQYRIHFSYPIEKDAPLYVAYIGPKLTKK